MIPVPSKTTLKKYGLSLDEWQSMYLKYNGTCHVCRKPAKRMNVDHEHCKGWKAMPPEKRKTFVRGLCCFQCNRYLLIRGTTVQKLRNAVKYLEEYEARKSKT